MYIFAATQSYHSHTSTLYSVHELFNTSGSVGWKYLSFKSVKNSVLFVHGIEYNIILTRESHLVYTIDSLK